MQYTVDALENGVKMRILNDEDVTVEVLKDFMGEFGRRFYRVKQERTEMVRLTRSKGRILDVFENESKSTAVVPFRRGEETWGLSWVK